MVYTHVHTLVFIALAFYVPSIMVPGTWYRTMVYNRYLGTAVVYQGTQVRTHDMLPCFFKLVHKYTCDTSSIFIVSVSSACEGILGRFVRRRARSRETLTSESTSAISAICGPFLPSQRFGATPRDRSNAIVISSGGALRPPVPRERRPPCRRRRREDLCGRP